MELKRIAFVLITSVILLAACSRGEAGEQPATPTQVVVTPSPRPSATPLPTSTPKPTPVVPVIEVKSQTLTEDGSLLIDRVFIPEGGWLAIYQEDEGGAGELLGYERLVPGENMAVSVSIQPRAATPTLLVQLHEDAGEDGVFEDPGPDVPLQDGGNVVAQSFAVDIQLPIPLIEIGDQEIGSDGQVMIEHVFTLELGWVVIHNYGNGEVGAALGQVPVQAGDNNELSFPIRWRIATEDLLAVLYLDAEQPGGFDQNVDLPVIDDGNGVMAPFGVSLPPDILVYDQPLQENTITVERAVSSGPGFVVAYYDDEGVPGLIIGSQAIEDGVNELVQVELLETAVTGRLYLILHEDTGQLGEFEFPAADLPLVYEGKPLPPFTMATTPGNYLISKDQALGEEGEVVVPLVVTDLDAWVVIYNVDETGAVDEIIGQTWLPAGINRDVLVSIDTDLATETAVAMLHQDNAPLEQFDYPDGADNPLRRNLLPIESKFVIDMAPQDRPLP